MELEYIQDAYTNKTYKVVTEGVNAHIKSSKKRVTFDSRLFLDDLFKKAYKYALNQMKKTDSISKNAKLFIGIDIVSYGASNAKMAYVSKNKSSQETSIDLIENHIGNLKLLSNYTEHGNSNKV